MDPPTSTIDDPQPGFPGDPPITMLPDPQPTFPDDPPPTISDDPDPVSTTDLSTTSDNDFVRRIAVFTRNPALFQSTLTTVPPAPTTTRCRSCVLSPTDSVMGNLQSSTFNKRMNTQYQSGATTKTSSSILVSMAAAAFAVSWILNRLA